MTPKKYIDNKEFSFHMKLLFSIIVILSFSGGFAATHLSYIQKNFNSNFKWICVENKTIEKYELITSVQNKTEIDNFCDELHCETEEMAIEFTGLEQPRWAKCQQICREVHAEELRHLSRPYLRFYNETYCIKEKLVLNEVYRNSEKLIYSEK